MANYVKFMRGTPEAYIKANKQDDTLYFISEKDSLEGVLYLGEKMIGGSSSIDFNNFSIDALKDVLITENLTDKSFLVYSVENQNWINVDFKTLCFVGATQNSNGISGFVPPPEAGETNLFLRSDGKWVSISTDIPTTGNIEVDNLSIDIYNNQIALKDYGKKYYKYNLETKDFTLQLVDQENPWKSGLEPKVVKENDQFILGWFEPKVDIEISELKSIVNNISSLVGIKGDLNSSSSGIFADLDLKANKSEVFTKIETERKIQETIAATEHLKRAIVNSVDEIDIDADNSEQYIYLVPANEKENNHYEEYLVVRNVFDQKVLERVGSWQTDLEDYVKKSELIFKTVNSNNFQIVDNELQLNTINVSQVANLENILNQKLTEVEAKNIFVEAPTFQSVVGDLTEIIQKNKTDIEFLATCLTWQDLK